MNSDFSAFDREFGGSTTIDGEQADTSPAPLVPLMDIAIGEPDARKTVLGDRFLCIGGGMLFVGPSGIGKSSASVQQDILWSLGLPAFGINPARPLKIFTIQAENDAEDLAEMRDGVCRGLGLTDEQRAEVRAHVFYETECGLTGMDFLDYLDERLGMAQFDLFRIDPLLAYLGADVNSAAETAAFLRSRLNRLLAKHQVACIINHHTPKTNNRDTSNHRPSDWMYGGTGSADITNWARAIVTIEPTFAPGVFKFIAAKRGNRTGWVDECEKRQMIRHFCHASDGIYWRNAEPADLEAVENAANAARATKTGRPIKSPEDMKRLVPMDKAITKKLLLRSAQNCGFSKHRAEDALSELLVAKELFKHYRKRSGTNAEVWISRHEQTLWER